MAELRWILLAVGMLILVVIYLWGRRSSGGATEVGPIIRSRSEPLISGDALDSPGPIAPDEALDEGAEWPSAQPDDTQRSQAADPREVEAAGKQSVRVEPKFDASESLVIDADDEPTISAENVATERAAAAKNQSVQAPDASATAAVETPAATEPAEPAVRLERSKAATTRPDRAVHKILVLRLKGGGAGIAGTQLRAAFAQMGLSFGRYEIFHYVHANGATVFSVASMVEPGSFDPPKMDAIIYPGVTLFAQLPGAIPGTEVLELLLSSAKQLQSAVGGTLQDERGGLLNSPCIVRMRQEVADFDDLQSATASDSSLSS